MSRFFTGFLMVASAALVVACSSTDAVGPLEPGTIVVKVVVPPGAQPNNGFYIPSDTVNLTATVIDGSGRPLTSASVDWQVANDQGSGPPAAAITSTGPQTARLIFSRDGTVGIIASVARNDGTKITSTVSVAWSRGF